MAAFLFLSNITPIPDHTLRLKIELTMKQWLQLALSRNVVGSALVMAFIVAPILVLINQGEHIFGQDSSDFSWTKVILTFLVPYMVSTVSSVNTLRRSGDKQKNPRR